MTEDVLTVINRRAAVAAARTEAERAGLDAEALLDSASLHSRLVTLNPDSASFTREVRALVQEAAEAAAARGMSASAAAPIPRFSSPAPGAARPPRQWTMEDVKRSTPAETVAAIEAGLLRDLGHGPRRRRR